MTNPNGVQVTFSYDNGRRTYITYPGSYVQYVYNTRDWITSVHNRTTGGTTRYDASYAYNNGSTWDNRGNPRCAPRTSRGAPTLTTLAYESTARPRRPRRTVPTTRSTTSAAATMHAATVPAAIPYRTARGACAVWWRTPVPLRTPMNSTPSAGYSSAGSIVNHYEYGVGGGWGYTTDPSGMLQEAARWMARSLTSGLHRLGTQSLPDCDFGMPPGCSCKLEEQETSDRVQDLRKRSQPKLASGRLDLGYAAP